MKSTIDIINETLSNNIFRMRLNDDEYPSDKIEICHKNEITEAYLAGTKTI